MNEGANAILKGEGRRGRRGRC